MPATKRPVMRSPTAQARIALAVLAVGVAACETPNPAYLGRGSPGADGAGSSSRGSTDAAQPGHLANDAPVDGSSADAGSLLASDGAVAGESPEVGNRETLDGRAASVDGVPADAVTDGVTPLADSSPPRPPDVNLPSPDIAQEPDRPVHDSADVGERDALAPPDGMIDAGLPDAGLPDVAMVACTAGCACDQACVSGVCKCTGGCGCRFNCGDTCSPVCETGATCSIDARGAVSVSKFSCKTDATCILDAIGAKAVTVDRCETGASCTIDCRLTATCDVDCRTKAQCLLRCAGSGQCAFSHCEGSLLSCPNGDVACNRPCSP